MKNAAKIAPLPDICKQSCQKPFIRPLFSAFFSHIALHAYQFKYRERAIVTTNTTMCTSANAYVKIL